MKQVLGYEPAVQVVRAGRAAFFGSPMGDLPVAQSESVAKDDLCPQFGYVGSEYGRSRVLILGINPGNGPRDRRSAGDEVALPALLHFLEERSAQSFVGAQQAYRQVCEGWPIWRRHCSVIIGAGRLSHDDVAYTNCLPWRTASQASFAEVVARRAAELYVRPLIDELKPKVVVALGKKAAEVLSLGRMLDDKVVVWNRAQAATPAVLRDRSEAAMRLLERLGRGSP